MPRNPNSTSGAAEDLVRAFVQMGCSEMHLKTLYEKTLAEMENGIADMSDPAIKDAYLEKAERYRLDIIEAAQLRRQMMIKCFNMFEGGDPDVWCMVKHLGISAMTAFETWQASDDDPDLLAVAMESNKLFTKYLSQWLGFEVTPCAACLSDMMKGEDMHG